MFSIFYPHLVQHNAQLSLILFYDLHKAHLSYTPSVMYDELQIDIFALYSKVSRILQACDVAVFQPLKEVWCRTVREWDKGHPGKVLNKVTFSPVLEKAIECCILDTS